MKVSSDQHERVERRWSPIAPLCAVIAILSCLAPSDVSAQRFWRTPASAGHTPRIVTPQTRATSAVPPVGTAVSVPDRTAIGGYSGMEDDESRIIVQFRGRPLSRAGDLRKGLRTADLFPALSSIRSEHDRFRDDLRAIAAAETAAAGRSPGVAGAGIRFEYMNAFNGVALSANRRIRDRIQDLPYVAGVWEDVPVEILDDTSNALIGAPAFWDSTGMHGEGIDIGIIDTGIDYFHEALGDGAFPNSKVVGGYDIVNDDPDPMDDYGHGTHVAGIAAGDSPSGFRGVAYKARLWAFKVLDGTGTGYLSWIIAGIERALDPDLDPATPTPIDVLNLSLGTPPFVGDPDDPLAQAIDNAFAAGVLSAVAAGNSGPWYLSLSSPGCAAKAVTVGASTSTDSIASFSSRGPSSNRFLLKPDIVAPGVGILSAMAGTDGYVEYNGTSMATPHVAGAIALLRQLHPDWTPEEIAALLAETAIDIGADPLTQGSGRLNLGPTLRRDVAVTPARLNFGIDDNALRLWTTSETLTVHNHGLVPVTISFSALPEASLGIVISFDPAELTIPAGEALPLVATLTVDNAQVPFRQIPLFETEGPIYSGRIVAGSSAPPLTMTIPFGFVKFEMIRMAFDERPQVLETHPTGAWWGEVYEFLGSKKDDTLNIPQSAGVYDLAGSFADLRRKFLVPEVRHDGVTVVSIRKSDAKNALVLRPVDHDGHVPPSEELVWRATLVDTQGFSFELYCGALACPLPPFPDTVFIPDLGARFRFDADAMLSVPPRAYEQFTIGTGYGIDRSQILTNEALPVQRINYSFNALFPFEDSLTIIVGRDLELALSIVLPRPFTLTGYHFFGSPEDIIGLYSNLGAPPSAGWQSLFGLAPVRTSPVNGIQFIRHLSSGDDTVYTSSASEIPIEVGFGAPVWYGQANNHAFQNTSTIYIENRNKWARNYFSGVLWEILFAGDYRFKVSTHAGTVDSGLTAFLVRGNLTPGWYALEHWIEEYHILDHQGRATVRLEFDTRLPDADPPYFRDMRILSRGFPAQELSLGEPSEIRFAFEDNTEVDSVKLFYRVEGSNRWYRATPGRSGDEYVLQDFGGIPNGYISLRIIATDPSGNVLDYSAEPAFYYHRTAPGTLSLRAPLDGIAGQPDMVSLTWEEASLATSYHLQLSADSAFQTLIVDDSAVTGRSLRIGGLGRSTTYYWHARGINSVGAGPFSDARSFTTSPDPTRTYLVGVNWNLVSLPLAAVNRATLNLYPTAGSAAFGFGGNGYFPCDSLETGYGYWLKFASADTVGVAGVSILADSVEVGEGWNLLGAISDPVDAAGLVSSPAGLISSAIYDYSGGYREASTLVPGRGYWVECSAAGTIILATSGSDAAGSIPMNTRAARDSLNSITFAGGVGTGATLYFGELRDGVDAYPGNTLPPPPPAGAFDVRFASGRRLESIPPGGNGSFPILVSAADSTLKITWETRQPGTSATLSAGGRALRLEGRGAAELPNGGPPLLLRVDGTPVLPARHQLEQNYPNPFNHSTVIRYALPEPGRVRMEIYNVLGEKVASLVDAEQAAGFREVSFETGGLPAGVYFYRIDVADISSPHNTFSSVRKMLYIK